MNPLSLFLAITLSLTSLASASEHTTLTDKKGRDIEVTLISHTPTHVVCVKKKGGNQLRIPLAKLDSKSVDLIKKFPLVESKLVIKKRRELDESQEETAFGASYFSFIDATVSVKTLNKDADESELNCQIYFIGKGSDEFNYLITSEEFSITPSQKEEVWKSEKFECPQNLEFQGYVLFVTGSSSNQLVSSKTSVKSLRSKLNKAFLESLSQLNEGEEVN